MENLRLEHGYSLAFFRWQFLDTVFCSEPNMKSNETNYTKVDLILHYIVLYHIMHIILLKHYNITLFIINILSWEDL